MTEEPPEKEEGTPDPLDVIASKELYLAAVAAFRKLIADAEAGMSGSLTTTKSVAAEHRRAAALFLEERRIYERDCRKAAGSLADAPIDFDAVKREIGRKLDHIRESGDPGGVS